MYLLLTILLISTQAFARIRGDEELLPIKVGGKIGFINFKGKVVIEPQFKAVGNFVDGLAPARKGGTYGYIDKTGKFVIPDIYDYAKDFSEGLGVINLHGFAGVITEEGQIVNTRFKDIRSFQSHRAVGETYSKKKGLIDMTGKLIVDTVYDVIEDEDGIYTGKIYGDLNSIYTTFDSNGQSIDVKEFYAQRKTPSYDNDYRIKYNMDSSILLLNWKKEVIKKLPFRRRYTAFTSVLDNLEERQRFSYPNEALIFVRTTGGYAVIDTTGLIIAEPSKYYWQFTPNPRYIVGNFGDTVKILEILSRRMVTITAVTDYFNFLPFRSAISAEVNGCRSWILYNGDIIWHGEKEDPQLDDIKNITHIESSHYQTCRSLMKEKEFRLYQGDSSYFYYPLLPANGFGILTYSSDTIRYEFIDSSVPLKQKLRALKVVAFNNTDDTIPLYGLHGGA